MDGVIANWIKRVTEVMEIDILDENIRKQLKKGGRADVTNIENFIEERMWKKISEMGEEFWEKIEPFPWHKILYNKLKKMGQVCFLSSPSEDASSVSGKFTWLKKYYKNTNNFIFSPEKHWCASPRSILIDDSPKKIEKFKEYGGHGYIFPNSIKIEDGEINIEDIYQEIEREIKKIKT